jgi:hypothetical protein
LIGINNDWLCRQTKKTSDYEEELTDVLLLSVSNNNSGQLEDGNSRDPVAIGCRLVGIGKHSSALGLVDLYVFAMTSNTPFMQAQTTTQSITQIANRGPHDDDDTVTLNDSYSGDWWTIVIFFSSSFF